MPALGRPVWLLKIVVGCREESKFVAHLIAHWRGSATASLSLAVLVPLVCGAESKGGGWGSCHATSAGPWPGVGVMPSAVAQPISGDRERSGAVHADALTGSIPALQPRAEGQPR